MFKNVTLLLILSYALLKRRKSTYIRSQNQSLMEKIPIVTGETSYYGHKIRTNTVTK